MRSDAAYLTDRHFAAAVAAALLLHAACFTTWFLMPAAKVTEIPVRVLNLKLGDLDDIPDLPPEDAGLAPAPDLPAATQTESVPAKPSASVWKTMRKAQAPPAPPPVEQPQPVEKHIIIQPPSPPTPAATAETAALAQALATAARQFVRERQGVESHATAAPAHAGGSPLGNSTRADAEPVTRYEQIVSAWMEKFKYLPPEADLYTLPVSGQLRIELDRKGELRRSSVERTTGYMLLDRVMLDMARRANPFPPAPEAYAPNSPLLAFVTTVTFRQQQ